MTYDNYISIIQTQSPLIALEGTNDDQDEDEQ